MLFHHFDFGARSIIFHSSVLWSIRRNIHKAQLAFAAEPDSNPAMLIHRLLDLVAAEFLRVYGLRQDLLSFDVVTQN